MATKFFVIDLNTTEACDTLDEAKAKAEWWMELGRDILDNADDDEIAHWLHNPQGDGLDQGDVEIYECDEDDEDIRDYDGRIIGRLIRDKYDAIEIYLARKGLEAEAEARGIE